MAGLSKKKIGGGCIRTEAKQGTKSDDSEAPSRTGIKTSSSHIRRRLFGAPASFFFFVKRRKKTRLFCRHFGAVVLPDETPIYPLTFRSFIPLSLITWKYIYRILIYSGFFFRRKKISLANSATPKTSYY